jgi:hypothetical protein
MHESTVSRVTNNKYVQTPRGVFELKYFFSSKLHTDAGEDMSAKSAKEIIGQLVDQEDRSDPLSDQKIADMLKDRGLRIARRMVARPEQLKLLPALPEETLGLSRFPLHILMGCHCDGGRWPPHWVKSHSPRTREPVKFRILDSHSLNTVCRDAACHNRWECFSASSLTFMVLGGVCTRRCRFCGVGKGTPAPPDAEEPVRLARAAVELGLRFVVVTSVTRDDLPDGGAEHFARCVTELKKLRPRPVVEVLVRTGVPRPSARLCWARRLMYSPTTWRPFPGCTPGYGRGRTTRLRCVS